MGEECNRFTYDVFISFRGEDTRHHFIGYLRKELKQKGIRTFTDDEMLQAGDVISPALSKAIEESNVLMVVLSQNYASSTWCLDELVKMLDCSRRDNQQVVFPIFYHVDPSDVRHQKNVYGEAMVAHENRFRKNSDKIQTWRSALNQVCQLAGRHISTGYEINDVEKIVEKVYVKLSSNCLHGKDPVGQKQHIEEVISLLDMKHDTICMLGIYGLGGIGKTELAKALYKKIVHNFEAASFLSNVREKSNKINGLEDLHTTLLSEIFQVLETELGSTSRGIYEVKRRKKVLLVLDDVDSTEQLNNLAGGCDWIGSGSMIIITTRDEDLLRHHRVEKTYMMVELNDQQSLELFCQNAFQKSYPESGYEDMSSRAVSYAKGLPLALKVIGSDLGSSKNLEYWKSALEEYKMNPNKEILDVLQRSYERLERNAKRVFLDIACFFKGERIEYVEKILKEFNAPENIKELVNKSLLTVEDDCLNMHDLIQDMGREVVMQKEQENPSKLSRLWSYKDVIEVLTGDSGSDAIEGIMLDPPQRDEVDWSGNAFEEMKCLRILIVRNTSFSSEPKHLPNYLRLLDWEEYPSKFFPPKFHPKDIIVFNLCKSYLILEKSFQKFSCLTTMNFSRNQSISAMPSVSEVPNLREIRLDNCKNLIKIHESVGLLKKLGHLSASGCAKLRDFPRSMHSTSLEVLDLKLCIRLKHFPDIENNMDEPLKIYMTNTAIEKLPDSTGNLTGLVCLDMSNSKKLKYLPSNLFMLPNIVTFKFAGCSNIGESFKRFAQGNVAANGSSTLKTLHLGNCDLSDEDLDAILNCFPELQELIASENNFVSVPACIVDSVHLTSVDVSGCRKLQKIPKCTNLRILNIHSCVKLEKISELPSSLQKVDARYCYSLKKKTLNMLWSQVKKETRGLEVVMYRTKIPDCFDLRRNGGNPHFWARGKFPIVALALAFNYDERIPSKLVELQLVINGQCVPHKGYYNFKIEEEHVLVCDLRLLFSEKEWLGLDALLVRDWNLVKVSCKGPWMTTLSSWGVFVYKQETNMKDVQFICPGLEYSDITNTLPTTVPLKDPMQEPKKMPEESGLEDMFDDPLLQALQMMKDESCESEAKSKHYWKLMEEHKALRQKFEQLENETVAAPDELASSKHQYHELIEKLDTRSNSKTSSSGTNQMHRSIGKEGCKKHEKVAVAILKGRDEELKELYDAAIEGFPNSQDLMSTVYLNGLRDGILESQAILLALDMDRVTPEEHVTVDDEAHNHIEEQHDFTHEGAEDNEILNETMSAVGIATPAGSEVDNLGDNFNPSGQEHLLYFEDFGRFLF